MNFSIGLTTNSFFPSLQSEEIDYNEILQWAVEAGFTWIEIRDPKACFNLDMVRNLGILADELGIEANLAWDNTDLGSDFDLNVWKGQLEKASVFKGQRFSRVTLSPSLVDTTNSGYNHVDFQQIVTNVETVLKLAKEKGVRIVLENSLESLTAAGDYIGIDEFMIKAGNSDLCLDFSNLLITENVSLRPSVSQIYSFVDLYKNRIPYVHFKSTINNQLLDYFKSEADLSVPELLRLLKNGTYLCVELPPQRNPDQLKERILSAKNKLEGVFNAK